MAPAGFCRFCACTALDTSVAVMPSFVILSGFSQTRMEYTCGELSRDSPTPRRLPIWFTRLICA